MRGGVLAFLSSLLVLIPMVAIVAIAGSREDLIVAVPAAGLALYGSLNLWLWARCLSWPQVRAVLERTEPTTDEVQLVYTYDGCSYSRPAQTEGAVGSSVFLKVDPSDPSRSSLVLPRPDLGITVFALSLCALVGAVLHAVAV